MQKDDLRPRPHPPHLVRVAGHEASSSSMASFPSSGNYFSAVDQQRRNKGIDMIENIFTAIFGGCCRPGSSTDHSGPDIPTQYKIPEPSTSDYRTVTPLRLADPSRSIPHPPEIRRLALIDEDLIAMSDVDRSGSLRFLFYQG